MPVTTFSNVDDGLSPDQRKSGHVIANCDPGPTADLDPRQLDQLIR